LIQEWSGERSQGIVLENGCGLGEYLQRLEPDAEMAVGLDIEFERLLEAKKNARNLVCAAGEALPFRREIFDLVISNEVIEHVRDDREAVNQSIQVMMKSGRLILFCPNRWYPVETHGVYWRGQYHFGNKLFVNYLPGFLRRRLAPHVRAYTRRALTALFREFPSKIIYRTVIFGGYDNIIARSESLGDIIRSVARWLEKTPLKVLGLSHFWVVEKTGS
jgi:SAM-dependent methyltransferase